MEPSDCVVSLKPCLLLTAILSGIALNLEYGLVYGGESVKKLKCFLETNGV